MEKAKLPDTPWHVGYVKKDENDPRRHKSRCVYNDGNNCTNPYMLYCTSSSHCRFYTESWRKAKKYIKSMRIREPRSDAGIIISCNNKKNENNEKENHEGQLSVQRGNKETEIQFFMRSLKQLTKSQKRRLIYYRYKSLNLDIEFFDYYKKYNFSKIINNTFTQDDLEIKMLYNFYQKNKKLFLKKFEQAKKI